MTELYSFDEVNGVKIAVEVFADGSANGIGYRSCVSEPEYMFNGSDPETVRNELIRLVKRSNDEVA